MIGFVYKMTCRATGKSYIGSTRDLQRRINRHFSPCTLKERGHLKLYKAVASYGREHWDVEVLDTLTHDDLTELTPMMRYREMERTEEFNTHVDGYNEKRGDKISQRMKDIASSTHKGKVISEEQRQFLRDNYSGENHPFYGRKHTEKTKQKISEANKGKKLTEAHKDKLRELSMGEANHFYGKKHSVETRRKISEANTGKHKGRDSVRSKPVINDIGEFFWSIGLAVENYGGGRANMSTALTKKDGVFKGRVWRYATADEIKAHSDN